MTLLYLIRHGETLLNRKGVFQGATDCNLNDKGVKQSRELALKVKDINMDYIFSSTLKRSYMTASYIASDKNLTVKQFRSLNEMDFGVWEGLHYKEIAKLYPKEWENWCNNQFKSSPLCGENLNNFYDRVIEKLIKILEKYKGKSIAIVSHDGVMKVMASFLLKMGKDGFWSFKFEHGKYSLFEIIDDICIIKKINI